MKKEKVALRNEKLQILYGLKTQTVDSVLSAAVRRTGNIVLQYKDGCLVIASLNHLCKSIIFFQVSRIEKFKLKEKLKYFFNPAKSLTEIIKASNKVFTL